MWASLPQLCIFLLNLLQLATQNAGLDGAVVGFSRLIRLAADEAVGAARRLDRALAEFSGSASAAAAEVLLSNSTPAAGCCSFCAAADVSSTSPHKASAIALF